METEASSLRRQCSIGKLSVAGAQLLEHQIYDMDAAFVPSEIAVRHVVSHKFTVELGPSILNLGKAIRNTIVAVVLIKCSFDLVQSVLNRRGSRPN